MTKRLIIFLFALTQTVSAQTSFVWKNLTILQYDTLKDGFPQDFKGPICGQDFLYDRIVHSIFLLTEKDLKQIRKIVGKKENWEIHLDAKNLLGNGGTYFLWLRPSNKQANKAIDTLNLTNGKWAACDKHKFSSTFGCKDTTNYFIFNVDGTFMNIQGEWQPNGRYKFDGYNLSLKYTYNKKPVKMLGMDINSITWLDKNRFYVIRQFLDDPKYYTFFERAYPK